MKFVNPYNWLYVKIYLTHYKTANAGNHSKVVVIMSVMVTFNLAVIAGIFDIFSYIPLSKLILDLPINAFLISYFALLLMNIVYFFYPRGRCEKILQTFDVESKLKESYYYAPGLIYVILTLVAFFSILHLQLH